jgi:hypothetical protein
MWKEEVMAMDTSSKVQSGALAPPCDLDKFSFLYLKLIKT